MQIRGESLPTPSDKTRERLMEAVIADPQKAPSLLKLLPSTPAGHDRLKRLYDENVRLGETWSERVRRFRRQNSAYFRDDLYVHLTRNSARRVYMNNPGLIETDTIYEKLVVEFRRLVR
jgi:hypothetical protein